MPWLIPASPKYREYSIPWMILASPKYREK